MKVNSQVNSESCRLRLLQDELAGMDSAGAEVLLEDPATMELLTLEMGRKIYDFLLKPADMEN